jgi:hypothetical protein
MKTPDVHTLAGILVPVIAGLALTACMLPSRSRTRSQPQPPPRQSASPQTEAPEPKAAPDPTLKNVQAALSSEHLKNGDFAWLEENIDRQRKKKERVQGGVWLLSASYSGLQGPNYYSNEGTDEQWQSHFENLQKWKAAYPNSISARVATANSWVMYAWKARGSATVNSVSNEHFRTFDERIGEARKELFEGRDLARCPEWYASRLIVARAQSAEWEEYDRIYKEGAEFEPTYYPLHREKATYLLPRWNGNQGDWARFADDASNKIGGDEGKIMYFLLVGSMHDYNWGTIFQGKEASWERAKEGYEVMKKIYGTDNYYDNRFAALAFLAEDFQTANAALTEIGDKWDQNVWRKKETFDVAKVFTAQASKSEEERIARIQASKQNAAQNP